MHASGILTAGFVWLLFDDVALCVLANCIILLSFLTYWYFVGYLTNNSGVMLKHAILFAHKKSNIMKFVKRSHNKMLF